MVNYRIDHTLKMSQNYYEGLQEDESTDLGSVDWKMPVAFNEKRHLEKVTGDQPGLYGAEPWRLKERMKTVSVALVMCLNVGVDPPDIVKTQPCARLECWIDPLSMSPHKALEVIGDSLQRQYERWQPRARYKQSRDPTLDDVKKLCISLRRNAKEERVLFHYNGHGVPKPTTNGEIWVFNKTFTQYIPLSIYDLQTWMGAPSIYVYDCSNAGIIIDLFRQFATQHEQEYEATMNNNSKAGVNHDETFPNFHSCLQLAACGSNQILPMNPELPADLFTACLTTPIKVALRWFVMQSTTKLIPNISMEIIEKLPGQVNDRRTLLGELNWIFTAITDTIAWNCLPRDLFQRLFRQDLLVASLYRNFLLAERIMRSYNCSPVSSPRLPPTYQHPMWQAWDLALDICLSQVQGILENKEPFQHSLFFAEQLTAFQVWLKFGSETRSPPEQLPIVLQVLLSQNHRLRALELLERFLDLGAWAVHLSLSVGIFPYVLKLLQSCAKELRPLLVFIWAKILAVDNSCQVDLIRENGYRYFLSLLEDTRMASEHRMLAAFVLSCIVKDYPSGQETARKGNIIAICLEQLNDANPRTRQWLALCLGLVWNNYEAARWCGVRDSAHEKLYSLLVDDSPEVRASAVFALGTFIGSISERTEHANTINHSIAIKILATVSQDGSPLVRKELVVALHYLVLQFESQFVAVAVQLMDEERLRENPYISPAQGLVSTGGWSIDPITSGSSSVRRTTSRDKLKLVNSPVNAALNASNGSLDSMGSGDATTASNKIKRASSSSSIMANVGPIFSTYPMGVPYASIYSKIWLSLILLSTDPHPEVSNLGRTIINTILAKVQTSTQPRELVDKKSPPSFSAPSSPSTKPSFLSGESPPANMYGSHEMHHSMATSPRPLSSTHLHIPRSRKFHDKSPNTIQEEAGGDEPVIRKPLISTDFVDWCCTYFAQKAKRYSANEVDPESKSYSEREWRYFRNARVRKDAEAEQKRAASTRLDNQIFINKNPNMPHLLRFHPYECHLAVADKNCCSIWDWEQGLKLHQFSNMNNQSTRITSMDFLNAHDHALLMTGSDDGTARIWRNYVPEDGKESELVTAWQALTDMLPSTRGSGLVLEWEQESSLLYVSGDVRIIRMWDCVKEVKLKDIPTGAHSCITSISLGVQTFVAGFGDGSIRVYDRRSLTNDCRVATMREHSGWIVDAHICKHGEFAGKIFSGSVAGDVKCWDPRMNASITTYHTSNDMTAMAVHPAADIFACGSANQFITIYSYTGENLSFIKYHDGFMGQRIGPVSCLAFHPHKVNLGAGSIDSIISVYAGDRRL